MEYYSATKMNEILPAATWMDSEVVMLNEISQLEKDKYHVITLICRSLRNKTGKKETKTLKYREQISSYHRGGG